MQGYQAGIPDFTDTESVVFAISTDDLDTNTRFAESLELDFAILSDEGGKVAGEYGVLMEGRPFANRVTFVIDRTGEIAHVESGMGAMDPAGAVGACAKLSQ